MDSKIWLEAGGGDMFEGSVEWVGNTKSPNLIERLREENEGLWQ